MNSSDYAIAQFRYLKRLLLVHGHWSYARNGNMYVRYRHSRERILIVAQDLELLLQEYRMHRRVMVVPDILRMEFELVRYDHPFERDQR